MTPLGKQVEPSNETTIVLCCVGIYPKLDNFVRSDAADFRFRGECRGDCEPTGHIQRPFPRGPAVPPARLIRNVTTAGAVSSLLSRAEAGGRQC
jgi:hypothetical protein